MDYRSFIQDIPDFPKPGIIFRDISPLLRNPEVLSRAAKELANQVRNTPVDKVVAIEARGFIFGALLAHILNAGLVMVRKENKLPGKVEKQTYALEYASTVMEIRPEDIEKGENVLIHDDVLATGGTAEAAAQLVERVGGNVVGCAFLMELKGLGGRERIDHYPLFTLMGVE